MIYTLGLTKDQKLLSDFPLEAIHDDKFEWYWVDFDAPTAKESQLLASFFQFHPLAVEDAISRLQRPKIDYYSDYHFTVIHRLNQQTIEAEEVNLFVSTKFVITYHKFHAPELELTRKRLLTHPKFWERGTIYIMYQIIDKIVDNFFPMIYNIEDHLNTIEDKLDYKNSVALMNDVFDLRNDLLHLRRTVLPMRDLLYSILSSKRLQLVPQEQAYFGDVHDHLVKLTEMVESNRELTADMRDSHMSMNAIRMNNIMMTLTIVSTIFIPLTFIAGIYGMNFINMPELEWHYGYFIVLGAMLLLGGSMLILFKKRGWLDFSKDK
ncbi:magnesium/cobalt transporter CorA [Kurthia sibirica]|uniref:Magnesium transport protein CorA n=1 Tax=Kurthia sibirica TaxID=202750 RepID=A0A2U3AMB7_9BACL|nr:magnesium/cobalt transporter CorA [Kurthia sibirica]PWI25657.1 magnesium and cobalt transport protein CorA [Kurthia sibirica]GEK35474.1 putative metal ion transporter YfjQ [Kurthia sibirica]